MNTHGPSWRRVVRAASAILIELWSATYGSMITAAMLVYLFFPVSRAIYPTLEFRQFNSILSLQFFPMQMAVGFVVGYGLSNKFGSAFKYWVWTLPLVVFLIGVASYQPGLFEDPWKARFYHFLGSGCRTPECFDQLRYTAPLCTSGAYSIGALLRQSGIFCFPHRD